MTRRLTHAVALVAIALTLAGCGTFTQILQIGQSLAYNTAENLVLDLLVVPSVSADAGADATVLTGGRLILNGSNSSVVSGSGSTNTSPTPPLTYLWEITAGPIPDANGSGGIDAADLTAADITLSLVDTAFPQFMSPIAGTYTIRLTVSWTTPQGIARSSTNSTRILVVTPVP